MDDKYYPKEQLDKDLQTIRDMNISVEDKSLKGRALVYLYYNQGKNWMVEPWAIVDYRENILDLKK